MTLVCYSTRYWFDMVLRNWCGNDGHVYPFEELLRLFFSSVSCGKRLPKFFVIRRRGRALRPVLTFGLATSTTWTTATSTITTTIHLPKTPPRPCSYRTRCGVAWWSRTCPRTYKHRRPDRCVMLVTTLIILTYSLAALLFIVVCNNLHMVFVLSSLRSTFLAAYWSRVWLSRNEGMERWFFNCSLLTEFRLQNISSSSQCYSDERDLMLVHWLSKSYRWIDTWVIDCSRIIFEQVNEYNFIFVVFSLKMLAKRMVQPLCDS